MKKNTAKKITSFILLAAFVLVLTACGNNSQKGGTLDAFEKADMSGYNGLDGYDKELQFVELTVADVDKLMQEKATFALFMSFPTCPWCNAVIKNVNDAALESGMKIAYINTRKNSSWSSNIDIDDYDIFVKYFGEHLTPDSDGTPHLYTPHAFFIKDGEVVYEYQGAHPVMGSDASYALSEEEYAELTQFFSDGFEKLK